MDCCGGEGDPTDRIIHTNSQDIPSKAQAGCVDDSSPEEESKTSSSSRSRSHGENRSSRRRKDSTEEENGEAGGRPEEGLDQDGEGDWVDVEDQEEPAVNDTPETEVVESERMRRFETLAILICLVGFVINQVNNVSTPNKVTREAPAPTAIFNDVSYIDIFDGDLSVLYEEYLKHEVTVTLYYAPWDATSRHTLKVLDKLAKTYKDVKFVAINCWQNAACSKYYQFKFYPSLTAYVRASGSIQYPIYSLLTEDYISTFIYNVINPVSIINERRDWQLLRGRHMAVLTMSRKYFNFGYALALESLRKDPRQRVGYALVRGQQGNEISLHLWNETVMFDGGDNPTVSQVSKWIYTKFHEPVGYVMNSGYKSNQMFKLLNNTKAFMIVRMSANSSENLHLNMMAIQYYSCESTFNKYSKFLLHDLKFNLRDRSISCSESVNATICETTTGLCLNDVQNVSRVLPYFVRVTQNCTSSSAEELKKFETERICNTHKLRWSGVRESPVGLLWGLGCDDRDNFKFLTLDANQFHTEFPLEAPAIIYDVVYETKYILPEEEFHPSALEYFVFRFLAARNQLKKSQNLVRLNLLKEKPKTFIGPQLRTIDSSHSRKPPSPEKDDKNKIIIESSLADTVIFFYTNWCGFCKSVAANFHRVAKFFSNAGKSIVFRTIDAENVNFANMIYAPERYPSLLLFPRNSTDSVRYSGNWDLQCLTRFVLSHCSDDVINQL